MATHTEDYPTRVYKYPVEYFKGDPELAETALTKLVIYGTSCLTGLAASAFYNYGRNRPFLSGVHRHVGMVAGGAVFSYFYHKWRLSNLAERDAAIRHYMELHPDDFPAFERRLYKDILVPWTPRR